MHNIISSRRSRLSGLASLSLLKIFQNLPLSLSLCLLNFSRKKETKLVELFERIFSKKFSHSLVHIAHDNQVKCKELHLNRTDLTFTLMNFLFERLCN